jgi:hypothetical protein
MDSLNSLLTNLDKIQGLSAVALVFFSCIAVGYALRFIKQFPNEGIPVVVILWGALAMMLVADARPTIMPARIWTTRNLLVGLVIGAAAWFAHKLIITRIESFFGAKPDAAGNTPDSNANSTFFNKPPAPPMPPVTPIDTK